MNPVDPNTFRHLLGHFATGVTVLTTLRHDGRPAGMTVSAVAAVSLDPPLLLVCIDKQSDCHTHLLRADAFALNVLGAGQAGVSHRFANEMDDRFAGVAFAFGPEGIPWLDGAVAHIQCRPWQHVDAGDHTVFIARVMGGDASDGEPLLHFRGEYRGAG